MSSRNVEFLDDLRLMLGDEQYLALISKYPEERFRLPSIEGAETKTLDFQDFFSCFQRTEQMEQM